MKCTSIGLTDPGLVRPYNQDNHYTDPEGRFFLSLLMVWEVMPEEKKPVALQ